MSAKTVFDFTDYKAYLLHVEQVVSPFQRGFRSRLAKKLTCQNAYISQVLNTGANFSLEQGLLLADFLNLKGKEQKYLLLLLEHARAGTKELKEYFANELAELIQKHLNLSERLAGTAVSDAAQAMYVNHWFYPAICTIINISDFQTVSTIAAALNLPTKTVEDAISLLLTSNVLRKNGTKLQTSEARFHISKSSPDFVKYLTSHRLLAVRSLENPDPADIHYAGYASLSKKDAKELTAKLTKEIENYVKTVRASNPEETLYCFGLDFFKLAES